MSGDRELGFSHSRDPLNPLDRVLALQDHHSFEYKQLMVLISVITDTQELCVQLMLHLWLANAAAEKAFAISREEKLLKEAEKPDAVAVQNEEIREKQRIAAQAGTTKEQDISPDLNVLQDQKAQLVVDLSSKNQEIKKLESRWEIELDKAADKFIKENFAIENGKLVSMKNPNIKMLDGAVDTIKKIFTNAKSPADMLKYNPHLIDHPERMMVVDDVRKEIQMAKKIDKLVAKDVRDETNKDRKIIIKRVVLGEDGKPVYETDAAGKKKVKTERMELTPETTKLKDVLATDESTKKKKAQLVCLGDVCFLRDEVIGSPVSHTPEQSVLGTKLLVAGQERMEMEQKIHAIDEKISGKKDVAYIIPDAPPPPPPYRM